LFIFCSYNNKNEKEDVSINNLKNIRKNRRIKTSLITEYLGISEQFYYALENGNRKLTEEYLVQLSNYYNVTTDYLIGRTKNPQGYILEGDSIPQELRDVDVEMIEMVKDATNSGISTQDIKEIIEYRKFQKGIK
jgi:transcriptional regulator with XRE-family HTH domain